MRRLVLDTVIKERQIDVDGMFYWLPKRTEGGRIQPEGRSSALESRTIEETEEKVS